MTAAVLAAIAAAETEALDWLDMRDEFGGTMPRWAAARLRLCARDRAALKRHAEDTGVLVETCSYCTGDEGEAPAWPCPDAQAVIDYWQGETP